MLPPDVRWGYAAVLPCPRSMFSRVKEESGMSTRTYESLASAAARMGVSVKTVRRRIAEGVLPVYRCGRILRLDPNDVDGMFRRYPHMSAASLGVTGRRAARSAGSYDL
jgi:excisionase family DNA binding protein